jgi:hypothetical protein
MEQFLKDWWGTIVTFFAVAIWVGKVQRDVQALQKDPLVTEARCGERQKAIKENSALQFQAGNAQFSEIKGMIGDLQKSHNDLVKILLEKK